MTHGALLTHILTNIKADINRVNTDIARIHADVEFLITEDHISQEEGATILANLKTPLPTPSPTSGSVPMPDPPTTVPSSQPDLLKRSVPPPPRIVQARALWDYNIDGSEPNDLSFAKGDIIEITGEANDDWWNGKVKGREGLFPSNHVEKLPLPGLPTLTAPPPTSTFHAPNRSLHSYPSAYAESSQGSGSNALGLQQTPSDPKKSKFGSVGKTVGHAAAGGLGFGAGAAIGSGIINGIF